MGLEKIKTSIGETKQYEMIERVLEFFSGDENIAGLILYGSLAAGKCKEDSDIDLQVLIFDYNAKKQHIEFDGVEMDLSYDNFYYTVTGSLVHRKEYFLKSLGSGEILIDNTGGLLTRSVEYIKNVFEQRPLNHRNHIQTMFMRYGYENRLNEAKRYAGTDDLTSEYILAAAFDSVMYSFDAYNNFYPAIRRKYLEELKDKDEFLWKLAKDFFSAQYLSSRIETFEKILKYFLKPLGGFLPEEWEIPVYGICGETEPEPPIQSVPETENSTKENEKEKLPASNFSTGTESKPKNKTSALDDEIKRLLGEN
ncbi:MAG TPA: nucleotidyltransferase domain-containing protein [bacterium]|nr:nucleotidyltransferase domain-containing protein [bacterium]HPN31790.1 nucleotidyltransferase domain-containing protein [bacterium]